MKAIDILEPIKNEVNKIYMIKNISDVFYAIDTLISELNGWWEISKPFEWYTMQELSIVWWQLAIYRANLIDIQDMAMQNVKFHEARIKLTIPTLRSDIIAKLTKEHIDSWKKPPTLVDIETWLDKYIAPLKFELGLHEAFLEKVKSYWFSIPHILERIESRIRILQGDRDTSKFYDFNINL